MTLERTAAGVPLHYHALHPCNYHPQPHVQAAALLINLTRNIPFQMQPPVSTASFHICRRAPKVMAVAVAVTGAQLIEFSQRQQWDLHFYLHFCGLH